MIFRNDVNTFNYTNIKTITKEVIEEMFNSQIDQRGELYELEEAILDKEISQEDQELILRFYCETQITTAEEDEYYPKLRKEMWDTYHEHGNNSKKYKIQKKEFEALDLKLTPVGRQNLIEAIVNKKQVTYFENLYTNAPKYLTVEEALNQIKNEEHKTLIGKIRNSETKDEKDKLKKKLPVVLWNGLFFKRLADKFLRFSDYLCADFDGFDTQEAVEEAKEKLKLDPSVNTILISPKGLGMKVLIRVKRGCLTDHIELFKGAADHFSYIMGWDNSCSDIARACFLSSDPDIFINKESEIFDKRVKMNTKKNTMKTTKQIIKVLHNETEKGNDSIFNMTDVSEIKRKIVQYFEDSYSLEEGNRNNNLFKLAIKLYTAGVPEKSISILFHEKYKGVLEDSELEAIIGSACKYDSKFSSQPWKNYELKRKVESLINNEEELNSLLIDKDINPKNSLVLKELNELRINNYVFWNVLSNKEGDVTGYSVNEFRLLEFLKKKNILCLNNDGNFNYYQVRENIIHDLNIYDIKNKIVTYLKEKQANNERLFNTFLKAKSIYSDLFLSELKIDKLKIQRDSAIRVYKYFTNGVLLIRKNEENEFIQYMDLEYPIHSNQIIQHEYNESCNNISDFETFIEDISGDNFESFCSAIGYLSTNYKSQSNAKAVIFNDKNTSFEKADGGRGKSLVSKAISKFSSLTRIDGKQFKADDNFALASVKETDDVVFIDDVKQGFHFTNFYNLVTDSFEITRKHSNKKSIPFELSPKLLLSSNYPIKGSDQSSMRRRFDLVLTDYYSSSNTPVQKFGKEFFTNWSEKEYNSFYLFMIKCVSKYLEKGLVSMNTESMKLKELIAETSEDFLSYLNENKEIMTAEYFSLETIKQEYFRYSNQNISARKLKSWLIKWCKYYEYNLTNTRVNNRRVYRLSTPQYLMDNFKLKVA